jgi:hypothetical protein
LFFVPEKQSPLCLAARGALYTAPRKEVTLNTPIIHQWGSEDHPVPPGGQLPLWLDLLHQRGISLKSATHFNIRPQSRGWVYPVAPDHPAQRWKAFPRQRGPKYLWLPAQPDDITFYDPHGDLAGRVTAASGVLILATGEPDVWALYEGGILYATATLHGEGTILPWLVDELRRLGVTIVRLWPDRDPAGLNHAAKLRDSLAGLGIRLEAFALPYPPDSKADINQLLIDVGPDNLRAALEACPPLELPRPTQTQPARPAVYTPPANEITDLYERWCVEVVEQAAVAAWNIAPPNSKNLSRRNFSSPLREDRRPSAQWSYTAHGFKDYATGEFYNTHTVADLLGVLSWADYKAALHPAVEPLTASRLRHFPQGVPLRMVRLGLNLHGDTWLNVRRGVLPNFGAAMVTYYVWTELVRAGAQLDDEPLTAKQLASEGEKIGFDLSRDTAARGLTLLAEWEIGDFLTLYNKRACVGAKTRLFPEKRGPKGKPFLMRPLAEAMPAFLDRLEPYLLSCVLVNEFPDVPVAADVLAEKLADLELTAEQVAAIDARCQGLFAENHGAYQAAWREFERRRGIFRLKYGLPALLDDQPLQLPEGAAISNAARFRDAVDDVHLEASGGVRENRYAAARAVGRTLSTHKASCDRRGIVAVPQYEEYPLPAGGEVLSSLEALDARALERGTMELVAPDGNTVWACSRHADVFDYDAWVARHNGPITVRVRRASIEKRREQATEQDLEAQAQESARQAAISQRRATCTAPPQEPPTAWPETYLLHQAALRWRWLGMDELPDGRFVTPHGEVVERSARTVWQTLAELIAPDPPTQLAPPSPSEPDLPEAGSGRGITRETGPPGTLP